MKIQNNFCRVVNFRWTHWKTLNYPLWGLYIFYSRYVKIWVSRLTHLNISSKSRAHVPMQKYDFPLGVFLERLSDGKQDTSWQMLLTFYAHRSILFATVQTYSTNSWSSCLPTIKLSHRKDIQIHWHLSENKVTVHLGCSPNLHKITKYKLCDYCTTHWHKNLVDSAQEMIALCIVPWGGKEEENIKLILSKWLSVYRKHQILFL